MLCCFFLTRSGEFYKGVMTRCAWARIFEINFQSCGILICLLNSIFIPSYYKGIIVFCWCLHFAKKKYLEGKATLCNELFSSFS